jgi:hypothetical protein
MKTLILTYTDGIFISGAFTSILDIYFNLRNFVDVDLRIVFDLDALSIMRFFSYQNFFGDGRAMSGLTKNTDFESDVIIISYELLANIAKNKVRLNIGCDRLIILDSLDIQRFNYDGLIPVVANHISCNECILLANPANHGIADNTIEYYHKLSGIRLNGLDIPKRTYNYKRTDKDHIKLSGDVYFENIGKGIFENIIKGNTVNYYPDGLTVTDGLCYYLKLFDIDPTIEHCPLKINLIKIINKLFFDKNDKVLELL